MSGDADVALAGGAESMSRGPYWMPDARWGTKMGPSTLVDPVQGSLQDPFHEILMGVTAENLAERMSISREDQDAFAVESHRRAASAWDAGKFDDEVVPVPVKVKRETVEFARDEHFRPDATAETMARLKPIFKKEGGTVTAGNASGMNDAGAAVVLMTEEKAAELGSPVRARILSWGISGCEPEVMGIGPVPAVRRAMEKAGRSLGEMERSDHELGLVTLCIGGGQGIALLLHREG